MKTKINRKTFVYGIKQIAKKDPAIAKLYAEYGCPSLKYRPVGYGSLLKIICGQQVSTAAARAITGRLDQISNPMTERTFLQLSPETISKIGLSGQKESYAEEIARSVLNGQFNFRRLAYMEDEEAISEMLTLKGVGRWTAEMYLIFVLRRPDVWPVDDLGIRNGIKVFKGWKQIPSREQLVNLGEIYKPWRSVAARIIWHYTNVTRKK